MSRRVTKTLSVLLAISLTLTVLPFGRIVNADDISDETFETVEAEETTDETSDETDGEPVDELIENPSEEAIEETTDETSEETEDETDDEISEEIPVGTDGETDEVNPDEIVEAEEDIEVATYDGNQPAVTYTIYGWDNTTNSLTETSKTITDYTVVTSSLIRDTDGGNGLMSGTFVVNKDTTITDYVYIRKGCTVNLVVLPGVTLTCTQGIGCGFDKSKNAATLNIYGTGKIVTTGKKNCAGIGGKDDEASGNIFIHGTTIEATGGKHAAGIGGGEGGQDPNGTTKIVIYAGTITAVGGIDGAGIGGGDGQPGAHTYIYGGTITARSEKHGAGIGGGDEEGTLGIFIYGGTITARGNSGGAGIGAGQEGGNMRKSEDGGGINIYGGNVTAYGGDGGAGIGGAAGEDMSGTILIKGNDTVLTVYGGNGAAGIGAGDGSYLSNGDMDGTITIDCGPSSNITITGGSCGAGIGAGWGGNMNGTFKMLGGEVKVYGGSCGAGIGGGQEDGWFGGEGGTAYIGGGHLYIEPGKNDEDESTAEAIGSGTNDWCSGTVYIASNNNGTGKYMQVSYCSLGKTNLKPVSAGDRSSKCHTHNIIDIRECTGCNHRGPDNSVGASYTVIDLSQHTVKCKYCGLNTTEYHSEGNCECGYSDGTAVVTFTTPEGSYNFSVAKGRNATLLYYAGEIVSGLTLPTHEYFRVRGWKLQGDSSEQLYLPGSDVAVYEDMTFSLVADRVYSINVEESANGSIDAENELDGNSWAAEGEAIRFTAEPDQGYRLSSLTYKYITGGSAAYGYTYSDPVAIPASGNIFEMEMPALPDVAEGIIVSAEFTEIATPKNVVNGVNVTLGGQLGLNYHVDVPDNIVAEGAKAVLEGPADPVEYLLSDLSKGENGYVLTYNLKAIFSDEKVTLRIVDSDGNTLDLYKKAGDDVEKLNSNIMKASIYDYVEAARNDTGLTEAEHNMVNWMYTYCAYSVMWRYAVDVPDDVEVLNNLNKDDFAGYQMRTEGSSDKLTLTAMSLILDSNTAIKLYVTCSDNVSNHTVTVGTKSLELMPTNVEGVYYVRIDDIAAGRLASDHEISFDGGSYKVYISAMTYVYNVLENGGVTNDVMNVLKAICKYSDAAIALRKA